MIFELTFNSHGCVVQELILTSLIVAEEPKNEHKHCTVDNYNTHTQVHLFELPTK